VDFDYLDVYDIELVEGRTFSKAHTTDDGLSFIVNEAFIKEFGIDNPIGKKIGHSWYPNDSLGTIIGVTKDFHFNSLHHEVNTLAMEVHSGWNYSEMSIKLNSQNLAQSIEDIENIYAQFVSDYPIDYEFLDDHMDQLYQSDKQMGSVITIIAILSIFIGCMGLYGLSSISIQRRIKEVGIRKVMGASVLELVTILSKNFTLMIIVAFVIASPITYFLLEKWLHSFAYSIELSMFPFLIGGILSLIIALLTISFHVIRAAIENPVKALKYE
ncbi:MAG: FtsX-like permease family protein, partial [Bacteroidota bacterium]